MKPFITNSIFLKYKVLQGNNNACSAIALAQIIYIEMEKQNLNSFFPSILFMYYNARIHKNLDEGVFIENLLQSTMEYGSVPDTMWQYYKEDPLDKPFQECYDFGRQFPIDIHYDKYNCTEHVQEFIVRQLLNDKIILCDIKNFGTNMDHTILILGMDEKDYICLDSLENDSLKRVSLSLLDSQLDRKDIYAISCSFQRKCLPQMTLETTDFEFYNNVKEKFYNEKSSFYYDHVILGKNPSSYYLAERIKQNNPKESILIIQNNSCSLDTNFQNSPIYQKTFQHFTQHNKMEIDKVSNPIYNSQNDALINFVLEPLSLSLSSPDLYYQITFCNKNDILKNTAFSTVFQQKEDAEFYFQKIKQDFPGININLPYYVILKIVLFYNTSEFLEYTTNFEFSETIYFGTFLEKQPIQYANLNACSKLNGNELTILMMKNIQYSDSIIIGFHELYNTQNLVSNFIPFPNITLVPFEKMFIYIKSNHDKYQCHDTFLGKGVVIDDCVQYMLFEKNIKILKEQTPNYVKENIYYPITMWSFFQKIFPNDNDIQIMMSSVSYFHLHNKSSQNDNEIIVNNFQKEKNVHYLNTNMLGNPFIFENNFSLINIFKKEY
jgi:hypothetical protein